MGNNLGVDPDISQGDFCGEDEKFQADQAPDSLRRFQGGNVSKQTRLCLFALRLEEAYYKSQH
jgi:hypothetical protein